MVTFSLLFHQVRYCPAYGHQPLQLWARGCFNGRMKARTVGQPKGTSNTSPTTKKSLVSTFADAFLSLHLQLLGAGEGETGRLMVGRLQRGRGKGVLVPAGTYGSSFQRRLLNFV